MQTANLNLFRSNRLYIEATAVIMERNDRRVFKCLKPSIKHGFNFSQHSPLEENEFWLLLHS